MTRRRRAPDSQLRALAGRLGQRATLHLVDHADHAFHVPVRSGRTDAAVLDELCATLSAWARAS